MTSIEWADVVWNPLVGCSRVSKGCEHCYAERVAHRGMAEHHRGLTVMGAHGPRWTGEVRLVPEALAKPLSWKKPRRVFVNSMSDLFHESVSFEDIAAIFGVMAAAPAHTFQVLTKRPARAREFFAWIVEQDASLLERTTKGRTHAIWCALAAEIKHHPKGDGGPLHVEHCASPDGPWPLPNVWLGVSVEDQATADARIPVLLELPAALRWVSYEPALGPVDFAGAEGGSDYLGDPRDGLEGEAGIDWIVIGGESGPGARPFDLAWARSTIAQCREAGTKCFVKQLGSQPVEIVGATGNFRTSPEGKRQVELVAQRAQFRDRKGGDPSEWPEDLRVRQWPEVAR